MPGSAPARGNIPGRTSLAALLLALIGIMAPDPAQSQSTLGTSAPTERATFPLTVRAGKRYLQDADGKPFLIHGDTAWSLIAQLTREDAEKYLDDRRAQGFNAILVNLLEHKYATKAPANIYGQPPFLKAGDFSSPNEEYFAHADWVLRKAADRGLLVLLAPAYIGAGGGSEGWYQEMVANGPAKLRAYGQFVGHRYRDSTNILWIHGGDYNPPAEDIVSAVAEGIRDHHNTSLHTAHGAPETAAVEYWGDAPWLQVNNVYTYQSVYPSAIKQYTHPASMPFFLLESAYEYEHHATELRVRTQAYHALLAGAAGQVYGNNPMWHFDGPGLFSASMSWQQALESPGAKSMSHLRVFFSAIPWWELEPDSHNSLLTGGAGSRHERAVAAYSTDRSFAVVYIPSFRWVRLDLRKLVGPTLTAWWFDPSNGHYHQVAGSPFPANSAQSLSPGVANGSGHGDWVLLLKSGS